MIMDIFDWENIFVLHCPFCGRDLKDSDLAEAIHTERKPDGGRSWLIHCPEVDFGCGVEMRGETEDEVIAKWNRRDAR
jgi:hypothetical protein